MRLALTCFLKAFLPEFRLAPVTLNSVSSDVRIICSEGYSPSTPAISPVLCCASGIVQCLVSVLFRVRSFPFPTAFRHSGKSPGFGVSRHYSATFQDIETSGQSPFFFSASFPDFGSGAYLRLYSPGPGPEYRGRVRRSLSGGRALQSLK